MLEKLKGILRVIKEYKCEKSYYYHLLKRLEEDDIIENKCEYCRYFMGNSCTYFSNREKIRIC